MQLDRTKVLIEMLIPMLLEVLEDHLVGTDEGRMTHRSDPSVVKQEEATLTKDLGIC